MITREQAIKEIFEWCDEMEYQGLNPDINSYDILKALGVTEEEIENAIFK